MNEKATPLDGMWFGLLLRAVGATGSGFTTATESGNITDEDQIVSVTS